MTGIKYIKVVISGWEVWGVLFLSLFFIFSSNFKVSFSTLFGSTYTKVSLIELAW